MNKPLIFFLFIFVLFGCSKENEVQKQSLQKLNLTQTSTKETAHRDDQNVAEKAVQIVKQKREVNDVLAVNSEKKMIVAYKVKHLERFRMKKIEKAIRKELEKNFPNYEIIVSSDLKLFWKTEELKQKLEKKRLDQKKLDKEIDMLKKLSKEQT
ncbi:peptidoglycan-synthase activator LpoB [Thermolongibacillus altinsuensis]|uniref:Peptidoglycan-synthase activator LpoB n=1 Tax=Thermolongibacillus altinsuensis TaxID=575256 RepID=A0A4R1QH38_9BACL|nr:YhcN/YlaJ family sporulation lipoprotein [Thermolongibacillus altinsuensis]TCL50978.1 peptidoglycan-synthase activator LpoB [Thermolongibacillus altinsuensis]